MAVTEQQSYNLGEHKIVDDVRYLVVRYVDSTTLFEEPVTGKVFAEHELYVELRDADGHARFVQLSTKRVDATRAAGPIKGVKPYFWKTGSVKENNSGN